MKLMKRKVTVIDYLVFAWVLGWFWRLHRWEEEPPLLRPVPGPGGNMRP